MVLVRGDDTDAFGNEFITIELDDEPQGITKAEFRSGVVIKTYDNPTFPLDISLTAQETALLKCQNECFLAIYDNMGRKWTCEGTLEFETDCQKV